MPARYDAARNIVFVDYRNMKAAELIAEAQRLHDEARLHFAGRQVRVLVDITGVMLNSKAVQALKDSTKRDSAMVERTAVVGVTGLKKVLADAIAKFSGTHTRYFDTNDQALSWLREA
jgi:hypothetical protein